MEENMTQDAGMEVDYLAQIQEMKKTMVSRDSYDKMRDENKRLLETIVNGGSYDQKEEPKETYRSAKDVREELFSSNSNFNNLEFTKRALELRDAVIREGGVDPFVPQGKKIKATREDFELAEQVAEGLRHCVEYADGDSRVFTNELDRITDDVVIRRSGRY